MDYQKFINQLPNFSANSTPNSDTSANTSFQSIFHQLPEQNVTTSNLQLLNWSLQCLESDEIYCQVGCFPAAFLVGALLNQSEKTAYLVDNLADYEESESQLEQLSHCLDYFSLEEQVVFCEQDISDFVTDLREFAPETKIGVYFYNASSDYRSVFLSLLLIVPFLADQAIIIVNNSNWSSVQQACADFVATQPHSQLSLSLLTPNADYPTFGNGIEMLSWDQTKIYHRKLPSQQAFTKALKQFSIVFETQEKVQAINQLYQEASQAYQQKQWDQAKQKYHEILSWSHHQAIALHDLGLVYFQQKQYQSALQYLQEALAIDPINALWHYHYAIILEQAGQTTRAVSAYQLAVRFNPKLIDAYNNLGNLYVRHGNFPEAESVYQQAIQENPQQFGSYINLGNLLLKLNRLNEAVQCYETALNLKPNHADTLHNLEVAKELLNDPAKAEANLGKTAYQEKRYQDAIAHYQASVQLKAGTIELYLQLADCYYQEKQDEQVVTTYQEAIRHYPECSEFYYLLAKTFQKLGRIEEAIEVANQAAEKFPEQLRMTILSKRLIPIIYNNAEEIEVYRSRYIEAQEALIQNVDLNSLEGKQEALSLIDTANFFLSYQGKNDLALQRQYGQFVHEVMKAHYPEWTQLRSLQTLASNQKIRVGYLSSNLSFHTIGKLAVGWMTHHNPDLVEVYCYHLGAKLDSMTEQFYKHSHQFRHIPEGFETVCEQILADELDILVFLDIGLDIKVTKIAGLRLAPIQCQTWLHPITSGIPTIDYFLSSDLMEPANGQDHYAETLICLPNLGIAYPKPPLPKKAKSRGDFQLPDDKVIYLSCQSAYKYLPQHDDIFPRIALQVPNAHFVFLGSPVSNSLDQKFQQRLQKEFSKFNLEIKQYCTFLPRLFQDDYFSLNLVSDIFLDTLGWSGGNTTLEAIAYNLPVVTCPGEFMRGRHSYSILKRLGITQTIAQTKAEYINIAVKLGLDESWRYQLREKISQHHSDFYSDREAVQGLENFYTQIVN